MNSIQFAVRTYSLWGVTDEYSEYLDVRDMDPDWVYNYAISLAKDYEYDAILVRVEDFYESETFVCDVVLGMYDAHDPCWRLIPKTKFADALIGKKDDVLEEVDISG